MPYLGYSGSAQGLVGSDAPISTTMNGQIPELGHLIAPVQPMAHLAQAAAMEMERVEAEQKSEDDIAPSTATAIRTNDASTSNDSKQSAPAVTNPLFPTYPPYYYPYPPGTYLPMHGYLPIQPPPVHQQQQQQFSSMPSNSLEGGDQQPSTRLRKASHGGHQPYIQYVGNSSVPSASSSSVPSHHQNHSNSNHHPSSHATHSHHPASAIDDFFRHAHDLNRPSHHHLSRYHRHAFAPYPQSQASSRQPSPDLSPRSELHHSDDDFNGTHLPLDCTPSTSPVLGPLRGMSLRNYSRPTSPVHLPSLRYPHSKEPGSKSANHSPTRSPEPESLQAHNVGNSSNYLSNSLPSHHSLYMQNHKPNQRTQQYLSRNSSRHTSPELGNSMITDHRSANHGVGSGTASHPPTPGSVHLPQPADFGSAAHSGLYTGIAGKQHHVEGGSLPRLGDMHLPHFSSSSYFPASHSSAASSQPGSRTHTPPLSPDTDSHSHAPEFVHPLNASYHSTVPLAYQYQNTGCGPSVASHRNHGHSHISGFSMTPISLGHSHTGHHASKSPSPAVDSR